MRRTERFRSRKQREAEKKDQGSEFSLAALDEASDTGRNFGR